MSKYRSPLSAEQLRLLSCRNSKRGWFSALTHFGLLLTTGVCVHVLIQAHWMSLAFLMLLAHGMIYTFLGYAGMGHELVHATVFESKRANNALFALVSFLTWNNPVYFRASHRVHHRHTLQEGVDYEVGTQGLKLNWRHLIQCVFDVWAFKRALVILLNNACNRAPGPFAEQAFPPASAERRRLVWAARWILAGHCAIALAAVLRQAWVLVVLITLAPFICTPPNRILAALQHGGMQSNTTDYRQSTRTVMIPKALAFLYWNMNYHIEHHMFPSVPYFNLPQLQALLAEDLPEPVRGVPSIVRILT